ncbi:MAG: DUF2846 domain-containing protein [Stenotrophobium sp.]
MKSRMLSSTIVAAVLALAGCASVHMAQVANDTAAKQFAPVTGQAVVYVYRNETFGAAIKMDVAVDNKLVGQTAAHTYFRLVLPPGQHVLTSQGDTQKGLTLDTQADHNLLRVAGSQNEFFGLRTRR